MLLPLLLLPGLLMAQQSGLAIVGKDFLGGWTADFWSPASNEQQCSLQWSQKGLSGEPHTYRLSSLDYWEGNIIACYHLFCTYVPRSKSDAPNGWRWWRRTLRSRKFHSSAVTSQGLLLVGGHESPTTTELLPWEGGPQPRNEGNGRLGFTLKHDTSEHCSIQINSNTIVLTGGYSPGALVTEYSGLDALEKVSSRELPPLLGERYNHACGWYSVGDSQVLLVTGGKEGSEHLDTTEVFPLTGAGAGSWREAGRLTSPREYLRAARVGNLLYVAGGLEESSRRPNLPGEIATMTNEILTWDSASESWSVVGRMKTATLGWSSFVVTEVPLAEVNKYCSAKN